MNLNVVTILAILLTAVTAPARTTTTSTSTPPPTLTASPGYTHNTATGSYYKTHQQKLVSWDAANATCASEGAHLVVFNDAEEADIVGRIMADAGYTYTWLGLRDSRQGGVMDWRTVRGEPISEVFHEWGGDYPNNRPEWNCAAFYATDKRLFNMPCDDTFYKLHFTCEISQYTSGDTNVYNHGLATIVANTIGYTYKPATRSFYKLHPKSQESWDTANATCASEGAHVVELNDAEEADIVAAVMRGARNWYTWTGLRYRQAGGVMDWRSVHGVPVTELYHKWARGNPRNDSLYPCAFCHAGDKLLYDHPCTTAIFFACEI